MQGCLRSDDTTVKESKGQNKRQPEAKAEFFNTTQCCAVELSPHRADLKFQAEIQVIMVIKNTESIESLQNLRKMANLGQNHLADSQKCVYLSTTRSEVPKMPFFPQFPLYFPVIHEDHHIPFIEPGNANILGMFISPDAHFAEVLSTKIPFMPIFY